MTHTERDFDDLSWHDCHIWGVELRVGEPDEDDWTSDLVLRLDFILEWLCGVGEPARFRVAPAELVFHGVTEPRVSVPLDPAGYRMALYLPAIDRIERAPIEDQKVFLDRPYYRWSIRLNRPAAGEITFGAVGFTQTVIGDPLLTDRQHLTRSERDRSLHGGAGRGDSPMAIASETGGEVSYELYTAGRAAMRAGDLDAAIDCFARAVALQPHFKSLELLGECLLEAGRLREAVTPLAAAATLNRGVRAPSLLSDVFRRLGDQEAAREAARAALSRDPDNRLAREVLGSLGRPAADDQVVGLAEPERPGATRDPPTAGTDGSAPEPGQ